MSQWLAVFQKDPDAVLDYSMTWTLDGGDSISTATWAIDDPPDADLVIDSQSVVSGVPTVWVSGGTEGSSYRLRCRVVTADGRTDDRTFLIRVVTR